MEVFFKILAFLLLAAGAFIVYGARLIASRLIKSESNNEKTDNRDYQNNEENNPDAVNNDVGRAGQDHGMEKQIVNIKITGMLFIIAGAILVLVAFR